MATPAKTRQRDSVRISKEGKFVIRQALRIKVWSQDTWADKAYVSISTIRRLVKGEEKIDRGSFNAALKVLGLNPDEFVAHEDDQQDSATPPIPSLIPQPPHQSHTEHSGTLQRFMITGPFSPNKLAEIEVALIHLEKLLQANGTFTLVPDRHYLAVSGTFSEDKKPEIEIALMHLEKLLLEHTITI